MIYFYKVVVKYNYEYKKIKSGGIIKKIFLSALMFVFLISGVFSSALNAATPIEGETAPLEMYGFETTKELSSNEKGARAAYYKPSYQKFSMKKNKSYYTTFYTGSSTTAYAQVKNKDHYSSKYRLSLGYDHPTYITNVKTCNTSWVDSGHTRSCGGKSSSYDYRYMDTVATLTAEGDSDGSNYGYIY